ncbi:MAG: hypothetical protein IPL23_15640 [Saprospiraceae bacterium]|nr:hypothetical protein [Saprospiraceae bacterium]
MKLLKATFYYLFLFLSSQIAFAQPESFYIKEIQSVLGGKMEVLLSGGRADIVNDQFAIEVNLPIIGKFHRPSIVVWIANQQTTRHCRGYAE